MLEEVLDSLLGQAESGEAGIDDPSEDFLDLVPLPITGKGLLQADGVFGLSRDVRVYVLNSLKDQFRDALLLHGTPLGYTVDVIHVHIRVL